MCMQVGLGKPLFRDTNGIPYLYVYSTRREDTIICTTQLPADFSLTPIASITIPKDNPPDK